MSEPKKPLHTKVEQWLDNQGYRLEHVAFHAFKKAALLAGLGYFVESGEEKPREIDAYAHSGVIKLPSNRLLDVRVLCECKYSKDYPWVLMQTDLPRDTRDTWTALPKSSSLQHYNVEIAKHAITLQKAPLFRREAPVAYSLRQARINAKDNRDDAYDSLRKICNAAWDAADLHTLLEGQPVNHIVIPCLVVEAPLLEARFNPERGDFETSEVTYGRVLWSGCNAGTLVDVVHASALDQYASELDGTFRLLSDVVNALLQ